MRVASGPDGSGTYQNCQRVRVRSARSEGATFVNQCSTLHNREAGSNLVDMGRCAVRDPPGGRSKPKPFSSDGGEATVNACGVAVAMLPE